MDFELALVRSGVVDPELYVEAVSRQQEERLPLGQIALETGALSARQVREVLQAQSDQSFERFGEVALAKGILKRRDLAELLMVQTERQRPLVQHLIELGALTEEQARTASAAYKAGARMMEIPSQRLQKTASHGTAGHDSEDYVPPVREPEPVASRPAESELEVASLVS